MSQPFSGVAITNAGAESCVLGGYPRIRAWGHRGWPDSRAATERLGISVHHGIYERVDAGPRPVVVLPHHRAWFAIGTGTAYQGGLNVFTLTRLAVVLPGTHEAKALRVRLPATRPPATRFPVGITAVSGSHRT